MHIYLCVYLKCLLCAGIKHILLGIALCLAYLEAKALNKEEPIQNRVKLAAVAVGFQSNGSSQNLA